MSWLMAALYDPTMRRTEEACLRAWREELLAGTSGDVLEIGAGTGANLAHYPRDVTRLVAAEPDAAMRAKLSERAREHARVEVIDADAGALSAPDATYDFVVGTLVLCSVADPGRVLAEVRRVLRPGGAFLYVEHVAGAAGSSRLAWQRFLEPVWKRVAGNCHLTRSTGDAIRAAGFTVESERAESLRKAFPWVRPSIRGVARAPA